MKSDSFFKLVALKGPIHYRVVHQIFFTLTIRTWFPSLVRSTNSHLAISLVHLLADYNSLLVSLWEFFLWDLQLLPTKSHKNVSAIGRLAKINVKKEDERQKEKQWKNTKSKTRRFCCCDFRVNYWRFRGDLNHLPVVDTPRNRAWNRSKNRQCKRAIRLIYKVRFCRMQPPYDTPMTLFGPRVLKHVLSSYNFFRRRLPTTTPKQTAFLEKSRSLRNTNTRYTIKASFSPLCLLFLLLNPEFCSDSRGCLSDLRPSSFCRNYWAPNNSDRDQKMCQRYFGQRSTSLRQNLNKLTLDLTIKERVRVRKLGLVRVRVSFRVSFWFCLSGVLRWAKISLAHFLVPTGKLHRSSWRPFDFS